MAIALWSALRQMESLRSAFIVSLTQGGATLSLRSNNKADLLKWAKREGIEPEWLLQPSETIDDLDSTSLNSVSRVGLAWSRGIFLESGAYVFARVAAEGTRTTTAINPDSDYGPDRSSANWDRWDNFLTTSAMLRFMATLEQYEIDALKALLFYRPQGLSVPAEEHIDEEVEERVIFEQPKFKNKKQGAVYQFPAIWTWIRPSAEANTERRKIFSRVYNINFPPPKFGKNHEELCDMRNAIAHGRARIDITLRELIQIHCYITTTMFEVRDSIRERYRLIL